MNKTENVSIGRKPFVCDVGAYSVLNSYLDRAKKALKKDPDIEEVMADLEQSMASHLQELSPNMVIDKETAEKVIVKMGEVDADVEVDQVGDSAERSISQWGRVKKFLKEPIYKDRPRQIIDGVCSGIARSLDVDPLWVRIVFVLLTFITQGFWLTVYLVLVVIMKEDAGYKKASKVVSDVRARIDDSNVLVRVERIARMIVVATFKIIRTALHIVAIILLVLLIGVWLTTIFKLGSDSNFVPLLVRDRGWLEYIFVGGLGLLLIVPLLQILMGSNKPRARNIAWSIWALAVIATIASGINLYPKIRDYVIEEKPSNQFIAATVVNGRIEDFCFGYCKPKSVVLVKAESCRVHAVGLTQKEGRTDASGADRVQYVAGYDRERIQTSWYGWAYASHIFDLPLSVDTYCSYIDSVQQKAGLNAVFVNDLPAGGFGLFDAEPEQKSGSFELVYYVRDPDPIKWYEQGPSDNL